MGDAQRRLRYGAEFRGRPLRCRAGVCALHRSLLDLACWRRLRDPHLVGPALLALRDVRLRGVRLTVQLAVDSLVLMNMMVVACWWTL